MEKITEEIKQEIEELKPFIQDLAKKWSLENRIENNILIGRNQGMKWEVIDFDINGRTNQMTRKHALELQTYDTSYLFNIRTGALIKYDKDAGVGTTIMYLNKNGKNAK